MRARLRIRQAYGRVAQACPEHILVRSHAGEPFERTEEVIGTEPGLPRESFDGLVTVRIAFDGPDGSRHSRYGARRSMVRMGRDAAGELDSAHSQMNAELLPVRVHKSGDAGAGPGNQRR